MVARQVFVSHELRRGLVGRGIIRAFEDGRAFVNFIEHRHIDHLCSRLDGRRHQPPVETPLQTRDGIIRIAAFRQIMPAEPGINARRVIQFSGRTPRLIRSDVRPIAIHFAIQGGGETPDHPRHDYIGLGHDFVQIRIGNGVGPQIAEIAGHTQHHAAAAVFRVVLEKLQELFQSDVADVVRPIRKTDAPDGDERLAAMIEVWLIRALRRELEFIHQFLPILDQRRTILARLQSREVIHHRDGPPMLLRRMQCVPQNHPPVGAALFGAGHSEEPLYEHPVNAVVLHPFEM